MLSHNKSLQEQTGFRPDPDVEARSVARKQAALEREKAQSKRETARKHLARRAMVGVGLSLAVTNPAVQDAGVAAKDAVVSAYHNLDNDRMFQTGNPNESATDNTITVEVKGGDPAEGSPVEVHKGGPAPGSPEAGQDN